MLLSDNTVLWLWLQQTCGPASYLPSELYRHFGSVEAIYRADVEEYTDAKSELPHLTPLFLNRLAEKELNEAKEILAYCQNEGVGILTPDREEYPSAFSAMPDQPIALYYRGTPIPMDDRLAITVIGTRNMTEYGSHMAYTMAYDMARADVVVVSGMAKGIDGMAHRGALDAGGYTIAVLGCGIDRAYPSEHLSLMQDIARQGLVMTEYRPFTPPSGKNFPIRNRIMSALGEYAVVVEAPAKSGALITAKKTLSQGRDVFAVPGKVGELNSEGVHELFRAGAKVAASATDILLALREKHPDKIDLNRIDELRSHRFTSPILRVATHPPYLRREATNDAIRRALLASEEEIRSGQEAGASPESSSSAPAKKASFKDKKTATSSRTETKAPLTVPSYLPESQKELLRLLGEGSALADRLAVMTGRPVGDVLSDLTMLEIEGCVTARPGGIYEVNS